MKEALGESIHQLIHGYRTRTRNLITKSDVSMPISHLRLLKFIRRSRHCTAQDIVDAMYLDKSQVARSLKELEQAGYIQKHPNPNNHRSYLLELTQSGSVVVTELALLNRSTIDVMTTNLSEQQIKQFIEISETMTRNLNESDSKHEELS
ncbi:MAG: MarR family winged helix-turn-helix transcriptional regulator [Marinomonas sp.]